MLEMNVAGAVLPHRPARPSAELDVVELRWPADADLRERVAAEGHACLLRVSEGASAPPEWGHLEDWLREPVDRDELDARKARLRRRLVARQPAWIDGDGLLRRGPAWVALPPLEIRLLEPLLARHGQVVTRDQLRDAVYGNGTDRDPRLIESTVHRLRRRIRPLGVRIHTVRSIGFLVEVGELD
jgi:hypothetical protein